MAGRGGDPGNEFVVQDDNHFDSKFLWKTTNKPPLSDHPNCHDLVVAPLREVPTATHLMLGTMLVFLIGREVVAL